MTAINLLFCEVCGKPVVKYICALHLNSKFKCKVLLKYCPNCGSSFVLKQVRLTEVSFNLDLTTYSISKDEILLLNKFLMGAI